MVSLVLLVIWELLHDDPVVNLRLLGERNFAVACALYLLFGAVIFGTTVQIPQMLQVLYGYTAENAGLALAPGALVVVFLAPVVVRVLPKIGAAKMIGTGFGVSGAVDVVFLARSAWPRPTAIFAIVRVMQGFGLACMFVPITQLAYSYLPKGANNKASSLTNLFRNLGGSLGIAFVSTMLIRRGQYHQSMLGEHITTNNPIYRERLAQVTGTLTNAGLDAVQAAARAQGMTAQMLQQQATVLSYLDNFLLLGLVSVIGIVLVFFIKPFKTGKAAGGH